MVWSPISMLTKSITLRQTNSLGLGHIHILITNLFLVFIVVFLPCDDIFIAHQRPSSFLHLPRTTVIRMCKSFFKMLNTAPQQLTDSKHCDYYHNQTLESWKLSPSFQLHNYYIPATSKYRHKLFSWLFVMLSGDLVLILIIASSKKALLLMCR